MPFDPQKIHRSEVAAHMLKEFNLMRLLSVESSGALWPLPGALTSRLGSWLFNLVPLPELVGVSLFFAR